jgi:hypothetical protein
MKTKVITTSIIILFLVSTVTTLSLVSVYAKSDNAATKITIWGKGTAGPILDVEKMWISGNRMHMRNLVRNYYEFIWSEDSDPNPDPRLTSASGFPTDPEEDWDGPNGATTYQTDLNVFLVDGGMEGPLSSKVALYPVAYWDGTKHTGWWEGNCQGKMWVGESQDFAFSFVLHGKGDFKGLKLMFTVSSAETEFEIQGYLLDTNK